MNPELTYTLELARVLKSCIEKASASQERAGVDLAFDRSLKRGHEAIIAMLHKACGELAPIRAEVLPNGGGELAEFIESLEYGEVPAPKAFSNLSGGVEKSDSRPLTQRRLGEDFDRDSNSKENEGTESRSGSSAPPTQNSTRKGASVARSQTGRIAKKPARPLNSNGAASRRDALQVPLPSTEKSRAIMSQWRD